MTDDEINAARDVARQGIVALIQDDLLRHLAPPGPKELALIEGVARLAANTAIALRGIHDRGYCTHLEFGQMSSATESLIQIEHVLEAKSAPMLSGIITDAATFCEMFQTEPAGSA